MDGSEYKKEFMSDNLVATHFLKPSQGRYKVWHLDGNKDNNYYKKLAYVSGQEYSDLKTGKVSIE